MESCEFVDLGLPSGTLWAGCNIGATKPEEYGNYFAWGEIEPKNVYARFNYEHCNTGFKGLYYNITKYIVSTLWAFDGIDDGKTELEPDDDAAIVNWGKEWQMPSCEQFEELINRNYTTTNLTMQNGIFGLKITSKCNGKSIFLPAAGSREGGELPVAGQYGNYWSRSLGSYGEDGGEYLVFGGSGAPSMWKNYRYIGRSIRPVRMK